MVTGTVVTPENTQTTGNTSNPLSDHTHPFFLHASDSPGMNLVNSPFNGKGYGGWKRSILIALSAKNKIGFIDGTQKELAPTSADFKLWSRCNDMVLSWLLNSLSKEIADSVIYSKTAKDLWQELEDRFGQSNGAQLYHLQKELSDLVQGSNDIAGYFTKIKRLWDELDALSTSVNCTCDCQCGGKAKMGKSLQDERLIQFLMGLNDVYAAGKSNILMLSPLPSVNHAYSLLMQDEKQREVYMSSHYPGNSTSFLATNQTTLGQKSGYYEAKQKKTNLVCSNCKKPGHSVDKCYRIIGFPSDFKFTKAKRFEGNVKSNAVFMEGTQEQNGAHFDGEGQGKHFTKDQCSQLIQMLQNVQMNQPEESPCDAAANAVTCAGPFNEEASGIW
ncbi:uncharacterized protein LOC125878016 [Solanum stenotomum]|uniref:uncharacterized protein LOC125878016 n=1 Tax=Solanum stenotomum TaxID=172797 RepID=UPI0020D16C1E|nr:uncharacterized protein LOC125878016 [Solanum stenotomum]